MPRTALKILGEGLLLLSAGRLVWAAQCEDQDKVCSMATKGVALLQGGASLRKLRDQHVGRISVVLPEGHKSGDSSEHIVVPRLVQADAVAARTGQNTDRVAGAMKAMLDVHNWYRCLHGASTMTWDTSLAEKAQEHADAGPDGYIGAHSTSQWRSEGSGFSYVGENLAWSVRVGGTDEASAIIAAEGWYNEIEFTDGTPTGFDDTEPADSHEAIGHYTQMIWDASHKLGCGLKVSDYTQGGRTYEDASHYWVCMYGPGGNIRGDYIANVFEASVDKSTCDSDHPDGAELVSAAAPATAAPQGPAPPAPTPPPPTPAPPPAPISAHCHDATTTYISRNGNAPYLACEDLRDFCQHYKFVQDACMKTCGVC